MQPETACWAHPSTRSTSGLCHPALGLGKAPESGGRAGHSLILARVRIPDWPRFGRESCSVFSPAWGPADKGFEVDSHSAPGSDHFSFPHLPVSLQKIVFAVRGDRKAGAKHVDYSERVETTAKLDANSALGYLRQLMKAGPADADLPRAEAISILLLAHPEAAQTLGIQPVEALIQTGTALEEAGQNKAAVALLETAFTETGESPVLLRAIETMRLQQRREQRHVAELISQAEAAVNGRDRSLARELIEQLRAADPKHATIGRLESRLDSHREVGKRALVQRVAVVAGLAALSGVVWLGFDYEKGARKAYKALPVASTESFEESTARLEGLEAFVARYPVWTGSLGALEERSELRVQVLGLNRREQEAQKVREADETQRLADADFAWREGKHLFDAGDAAGAVEKFQAALDLAGDGWDRADRVRRDLEAIRQTTNTEESK